MTITKLKVWNLFGRGNECKKCIKDRSEEVFLV